MTFEVPKHSLKIYRDTPAGMIPCDGGLFVRLDDAARYFQWETLNRVLGLVQNFEGKTIPRSKFYHAIMDLRPVSIDPLLLPESDLPDENV